MRRFALAAIGVSFWTSAACASDARNFSVSSGPLGAAVVELGRQAGLSIGLTDSILARQHSGGVRGRHSLKDALRLLLRGTDADFVLVNGTTVRIIRARPKPPPVARPVPVRLPAPAAVEAPDIIVTASKQRMPLSRYPATVTIWDLKPEEASRFASRGSAALVARLPMLASTDLGPGRNKLFIRGIADSSFNGETQATVGQYLGDVRLTYNAPDPDLNLYDIERVEIVEGPQGTLYGTGSIGGVIRLVPRAPDAGGFSGSISAGFGTTEHGGTGVDGAAMLNVPLSRDRLALRAVAYGSVEPGYIDDPSRGRSDINRTRTNGGRLALRWEPPGNWTVDVGAALQNIASRDGQYTLQNAPDLTRYSRIAQPFDNDYALAYVTTAHDFGQVAITSTTAVVRQSVSTTFDASGASQSSAATEFQESRKITLFSHESRITGGARRPWLLGIAGIYDLSRVSRALGPAGTPTPISGVRNEAAELAGFGQLSFPLMEQVQLTLGGRLTFTHLVGSLIDDPDGETVEPRRRSLSFSPSAALACQVDPHLLIFARIQHGVRAGGLAVSPTGSARDAKRFDSDTLAGAELGLRIGDRATDRFWASATASYARWTDIQADLIDSAGLPYTTNIGDGYIAAFEAEAGWSPARNLELQAGIFANTSALSKPLPDFIAAQERELPNIAGLQARAGIRYSVEVGMGTKLLFDGALRYVGKSHLGIRPEFNLEQGAYLTGSLGLRFEIARVGISLDVDNLGNIRGNRFAFGNPFGIAAGNQITPLRPRNFRLGLDTRF